MNRTVYLIVLSLALVAKGGADSEGELLTIDQINRNPQKGVYLSTKRLDKREFTELVTVKNRDDFVIRASSFLIFNDVWKGQVVFLVNDVDSALRLEGLPTDKYGKPSAAKLDEKVGVLELNLSNAVDHGFIVREDLKTGEILDIEEWGAW